MSKSVDHDCLSILSKIFLCLDGRMSESEEREFLVDVERCPYCLNQFNIDKAFKEFLLQKLTLRKIKPELIVKIRESIHRKQSGN